MTNGGHSKEAEIAVFIGLGSNIGDREANMRDAITRIAAVGLEIERESSIYETEPIGYKDQSWFLNQVLKTRPTPRLTTSGDAVIAVLTKALADTPEIFAPFWIYELLMSLLNIERAMGRERGLVNGPRVIDIDLLLCGDFDSDEFIMAQTTGQRVALAIPFAGDPDLTLPHPRMHLRRFVLEPLCEIAPETVHPVLNKSCRELLAEIEDSSVVRLYKEK